MKNNEFLEKIQIQIDEELVKIWKNKIIIKF